MAAGRKERDREYNVGGRRLKKVCFHFIVGFRNVVFLFISLGICYDYYYYYAGYRYPSVGVIIPFSHLYFHFHFF